MPKDNHIQEGNLTKITTEILEISKDIKGHGLEILFNTAAFIHSILKKQEITPRSESEKQFCFESHKRTAEEILKSGYSWSCADIGLVFVTLLRSKGMPCSYIQTVDVIALKNNAENIQGHVYCACFINDDEYLFDPDKGVLIKVNERDDRKKLYKFKNIQKQIEVFEGIDSSEFVSSQKKLEEMMVEASNKYWSEHSSV
jgi:hypothetical protein